MKTLHPLIERALELYPELVGDFLRNGKTKDGKTKLRLKIDGKWYILKVKDPLK